MWHGNCWRTTAFAPPTSASPSSVPRERPCLYTATPPRVCTLRSLALNAWCAPVGHRGRRPAKSAPDAHYEFVAGQVEIEREERAAFTLTLRQIARGGLDIGGQAEIQACQVHSLRSQYQPEQVVEFGDSQGRSDVGSVHASGAQSSVSVIARI